MIKSLSTRLVLVAAAALIVGCGSERNGSVLVPTAIDPTATSPASGLLGTWTQTNRFGTQAIGSLPSPNSCTEFSFTMTSQTSTSATGTFIAQCPGNLTLTGSASGQLGGATIPMIFTGIATTPGEPGCAFVLNGTGIPQSATQLQITYTGTTACVGPVAGTVTLRLSPPAPPTPPPAPAPAPAPVPPPSTSSASDPLLGCGSLVGGEPFKVIECIHDRLNAPRTVEGAFEITKRVAWAYRGEGVGLLIKNGGENIVSWKGYSFAAARVCLPDGHIYKVLTDVPTTNGPSLQDNGSVDRGLYVPAIDPRS